MSNYDKEVNVNSRRQFLTKSGLGLGLGLGTFLAAGVKPAFAITADDNTTVVTNETATMPPFANRVLMKMGFGHRPGDIEHFMGLGANNYERLMNYIEEQLDPANINDRELKIKINDAGFKTLDLPLATLWRDYARSDTRPDNKYEYRMLPVFEAEREKFLRAIYSRKQLVEILADFWHSHFNVYGRKDVVGSVFVQYDRNAIRPHILGRFRDLLEAVTMSTAMMYYLDNYANKSKGPNENFSRELLELYTFGANNSFGFSTEEAVPKGSHGMSQGYTEEDVKTIALCLTGWTIQNGAKWPENPWDNNNGKFFFRNDWHNQDSKRVFGVDLEASGKGEMQQVFDMLSRHPKVAEFVCDKLCRRFISDTPSQDIIQRAANIFLHESDAPDQLAIVVRFILRSAEFRKTWGLKVKRPFETVCSAMRVLDADLSFSFNDKSDNWGDSKFWFDSSNFMLNFETTGNLPFGWGPPNGFPDVKEAWLGNSSLMATWKLLGLCVNQWADEKGRYRIAVNKQTWIALPTPEEHTAVRLADFWLTRILGVAPEPAQRKLIINFMAQNGPITQQLDIESDQWDRQVINAHVKSRLRMMVNIIVMMPQFFLR